ncbi:MAG TPA: ribonuclease III [Gammaproteobacteria bacterium]|nr:ribonuclease III [Gammaproteobacteria bacterium]
MAAGDIRQTGRHTPLSSRTDWAESTLHYRFSDPLLLELALTHRSAGRENNERLEFLGDAFLNFIIAKRLYESRSEHSEGDLSRARASLVRQSTLAEMARALGLDEQLVLGRGELRSGAAHRGAILADAFEALVGAVLLDGGHDAAERLVDTLFADRFARLPEPDELKDSKTKLQEWLQGRGMRLPSYSIDSVHGREHEQVFTVVCEVEQRAKGQPREAEGGSPYVRTHGRGSSRRIAEQRAAAAMLAELESHAE